MKKSGCIIVLAMLLMSALALTSSIQQVKASGTIYIRADGSVDPSTAPIQRDGDIYTLTGNTTSDAGGIVIERNNMTLDGASYTLQGTHTIGRGIYLSGRSNVTIRNTQIKSFYSSIWLDSSSGNSISGNNITDSATVVIWLGSSSNNLIVGNNITNNDYGIALSSSSNHNIIVGNNIRNKLYGIELVSSSNNSIIGNNITTNNHNGIWLDSSSGNSISGNNITNNDYGIVLRGSSNNSMMGNEITNNGYGTYLGYGIYLQYGSNNSIVGENITNNLNGIGLSLSSNNSIIGNNITTNNGYGIHFYYLSDFNRISGNNIRNNEYGIRLDYSPNNKFYHNNFVDNAQQVYIETSGYANVWNDGYPSGGNYWSDYTGADVYQGSGQDIGGSDGLGDIPYVIDTVNIDHYPLMNPWGAPPVLYQLTVTSTPLAGIPFTINAVSKTTPYTESLAEGYYTLEMPQTYKGYVWSHWLEDGDTNRIKTIYLHGTTWTGVYALTGPQSPPVGGEWVPIDKLPVLTPWISSISLMIVLVASFVYVKHKKKQQN